MIQPKYNKQNNAIFLGFDSIEINLVLYFFRFSEDSLGGDRFGRLNYSMPQYHTIVPAPYQGTYDLG